MHFPFRHKVRMTCCDLHCPYFSSEVMAKLIGWNITWQPNISKLEQNPEYSGCPPISIRPPHLVAKSTLSEARVYTNNIESNPGHICDLIPQSHLSVNAVLCYHSCALIFLPSYRGFLERVTAFQHHCLLCWHQLLLKHWILWSKNQVIQKQWLFYTAIH